jgi:hypothetical protein
LLIAFGVKLAIFPLHTWLPDAHGEASSPVSMILAGVLLKMGGYGLIRLNLDLLADAHVYFAPVLAILGVVNIIYGALNSFAQRNMKRRLAYSSISHMGFVLIGIASFTDLGINGAMLQMISHGLIASVLFFLAGVTYDRSHTMMMAEMGGIGQAMLDDPGGLLSTLNTKWVMVQETFKTLAMGLVPDALLAGEAAAVATVDGLSTQLVKDTGRLNKLGKNIGKAVGVTFKAQLLSDIAEAIREVEATATAARAEKVASAARQQVAITNTQIAQAVNLTLRGADARNGLPIPPVLA